MFRRIVGVNDKKCKERDADKQKNSSEPVDVSDAFTVAVPDEHLPLSQIAEYARRFFREQIPPAVDRFPTAGRGVTNNRPGANNPPVLTDAEHTPNEEFRRMLAETIATVAGDMANVSTNFGGINLHGPQERFPPVREDASIRYRQRPSDRDRK